MKIWYSQPDSGVKFHDNLIVTRMNSNLLPPGELPHMSSWALHTPAAAPCLPEEWTRWSPGTVSAAAFCAVSASLLLPA